MKMFTSAAAIIICTSMLAGCTSEAALGMSEETSVSEETLITASDTETTEDIPEASAIEVNMEYTEEEIADDETDVAIEEDFAEPVDEPIAQEVYVGESIPENARVYKFDSSDPENLPEFSMSLDGYGDYAQTNIARMRLEIKAILECSQTGEIPYMDQSGFIGKCRRLENVKIGGWSVKDEKYSEDPFTRYEFTLTLDVTESESEFIPVGTADYLLVYYPGEDRLFLPLRKVGELDESRLLPSYGDSAKEYATFCTYYTAYFKDFFDGDVIEDLSAPETNLDYIGSTVFCAYVAASRGGGFKDNDSESIPYAEFNETLQKILGFSADAINAKNCPYYNAETDCIEIPGRGTSWLCGWLTEDIKGEEDSTRIVTVDYYEDDFYLVKARTVRYTVRENDDGTCSMLKIERLFTSDRDILGGAV